MEYRYDAFISYNHNPRDMKIARIVQHELEHFKIPKEIAERTGCHRIDRVFRDKGELEVTGDLNETIKKAIGESRFLIVICSPESKNAIWVTREIELFLENNTKDNILTVLTAGEPADSFQDILQYDEAINADGTTERRLREPMACDYRGKIRKANNEELPRLVSAIIGCHYDDLMQRRRHYQMRRRMIAMGTVTALLAIALGYFTYSNHQINLNYENTLREQSRTLTFQSRQALAEGDRIGAIQYALDALPSDNYDRPVLSESILALTEATNLYKPPSSEGINAVRSFIRSGYAGEIKTFSSGEDLLLTSCSEDAMRVWNAVNGKELSKEYLEAIPDQEEMVDVLYLENGNLLLVSSDSNNMNLRAFDPLKGKESWKKSIPGYPGTRLLKGNDEPADTGALWIPVTNDDTCVLYRLDPETGKAISKVSVASEVYRVRTSADGAYAAAVCNDSDRYSIHIYHAGTKELTDTVISGEGYVTDASFNSDGTLAALSLSQEPEAGEYTIDTSVVIDSDFSYYSKVCDREVRIQSFDSETGQKKWDETFREKFAGVPYLTLPGSNRVWNKHIIATTGSKMRAYSYSGKLDKTLDFGSDIIAYDPSANKDKKRLSAAAILHDGGYGVYHQDGDYVTNLRNSFLSPVDKAAAGNGQIFVESWDKTHENTFLNQYSYSGSDERWKDYRNAVVDGETFDTVASSGGKFIETNFSDGLKLQCRDPESGKILWNAAKDGYYTLAGTDEDNGMLYYISTTYDGSNTFKLVGVDAKTGKTEENAIKLPKDSEYSDAAVFGGGTIFWLLENNDGDVKLGEYDVAAEKTKTVSLKKLESYFTGYNLTYDDASGLLFIWSEDEILACDIDGKLEYRIKDVPYAIRAVATIRETSYTDAHGYSEEAKAAQNRLFVFGESDGTAGLYRFETKDGAPVDEPKGAAYQELEFRTVPSFTSTMLVTALPEGELLVAIEDHAFIYGGEDSGLCCSFLKFTAYDERSEQFYISSFADGEAGHFPYIGLKNIIDRGNKIVIN